MKTKEELNALRNEVETLNRRLAELSEEELAQVAGGMSDIDESIMNGTVMGHLYNAFYAVKKTNNSMLITMTTYLLMKCTEREYALIVSTISELLPTGVYDSPDKAAYDSLKLAKETIEKSGILNG